MNRPSLRTRHLIALKCLSTVLILACGRGPASLEEGSSESEEGSSRSESGEVTSLTVSSGPETTGPETTGDGDCEGLHAPVVQQLEGPIAAADLAFDDQGNLVGSNTQDLFRTPSGGSAQLWVPGMPGRAATRFLPDGRLVYVQEELSRVMLVGPDGTSEVLASNLLYPFGVTVDQAGLVFVADSDRIVRIDPATGQSTVWVDFVPGGARWLSFGRDYDEMFVGGLTAAIYRIGLTPDGGAQEVEWWGQIPVTLDGGGADPVPAPGETAGTGDSGGLTAASDVSGTSDGSAEGGSDTGFPGDEALIDGLGVDACGNVWVAEFYSTSLYMIPQWGGEGEVVIDWTEIEYGHGLEWGSGIGDWSETALYLPQPYNENKVIEVEIGVPSKTRVFP